MSTFVIIACSYYLFTQIHKVVDVEHVVEVKKVETSFNLQKLTIDDIINVEDESRGIKKVARYVDLLELHQDALDGKFDSEAPTPELSWSVSTADSSYVALKTPEVEKDDTFYEGLVMKAKVKVKAKAGAKK